MNKKGIAKQLTKNLLLTFAISCVLTFFTIQIYYSKQADSLEGNQGIFILTLASLFWTLVLTISSLAVFFNLYDKVRRDIFLSTLTFYLLPILVTTIFFIKTDFQEMWGSFFVVTTLYFLTLTYFFIKFRKNGINKI